MQDFMTETMLYTEFAADLHTLIEMRQTDEEAVPTENEWLHDPDRSLVAFYSVYNSELPMVGGDETGRFVNVAITPQTGPDIARGLSEWYAALAGEEGAVPSDDYKLAQSIVRKVQKDTRKTTDPVEMVAGCELLGYIAALTKPEGITKDDRLRKYDKEPPERRTFRMAINALKQLDEQKPMSAQSEFDAVEYARQLDDIAPQTESQRVVMQLAQNKAVNLKMDFNEQAARVHAETLNWLLISNFSKEIYTYVFSDRVNAEGFKAELAAWQEIWREDVDIAEVEPIVEATVETKWTILPPGILEQLGIAVVEDLSDKAAAESSPRVIDMDRLRFLGSIVLEWGGGAYIAVANLDATGDYEYRAAVLPERLPDGTVINHVVAENPADENAAFVFRAEQGMDEDGVWLTWEDVFDTDKKSAERLGARRMLHVANFRSNVWEYLTRSAKELNRRGYRR